MLPGANLLQFASILLLSVRIFTFILPISNGPYFNDRHTVVLFTHAPMGEEHGLPLQPSFTNSTTMMTLFPNLEGYTVERCSCTGLLWRCAGGGWTPAVCSSWPHHVGCSRFRDNHIHIFLYFYMDLQSK